MSTSLSLESIEDLGLYPVSALGFVGLSVHIISTKLVKLYKYLHHSSHVSEFIQVGEEFTHIVGYISLVRMLHFKFLLI